MKLTRLGPNAYLMEADSQQVLFSYNVAVALKREGRWLKTAAKYSATTSKHVGQHAPGAKAVEHGEFVRMLEEEA